MEDAADVSDYSSEAPTPTQRSGDAAYGKESSVPAGHDVSPNFILATEQSESAVARCCKVVLKEARQEDLLVLQLVYALERIYNKSCQPCD